MFYVPFWLPFEEWTLAIREVLPILAGAPFRVPDHLAVAQGQLTPNPLRSRPARARGIQQAELALLEAQHRHIGFGAYIQVAQFLVMNLLRRRPGGHADHV